MPGTMTEKRSCADSSRSADHDATAVTGTGESPSRRRHFGVSRLTLIRERGPSLREPDLPARLAELLAVDPESLVRLAGL
jgi:hypothetical protein